MARESRKNVTKVVNKTGETIQLVDVSACGHRSLETTLANDGEYRKRRKSSDTNCLLEVYYGSNILTNIIITSDDLLQNKELTITKKPPPPAMDFELVKEARAHPQSW